MSLCIAIAGKAIVIPAVAFSLSWVHSVEKIEWRENWVVTEAGLELQMASVKGSGAGMEPGENARLENGWWTWAPKLPTIPELRLASSGATVGGWRLCHSQGCLTLGEKPGEDSVITPCSK
ncbi:DUF1850 domain-containing protein [Ciceribacter sp. L1K23]|uniref:DUF1850 domain-containing protein n=1 Tax=Ciceribacter sp. L1K23 TaxID=2820276 RepID=UPI001B845EC0|nr:DUF1850 domain-containing protein [Ciceribacter sp. L1K23]MBR0556728.1 DUF1850 domain-containing protein [Ciceribacter sp. L1K23]